MEDRRCKLGLQGRAQSVLLIERAGHCAPVVASLEGVTSRSVV
jgi:hypothetical protein